MTVPVIGFGSSARVRINLPQLIESRLLIQANSGGGKSRAIRYVLEQTFGQVQHIVLDREGEFATLRSQFAYLLVGREGDVATDLRTAKLLARKVMELGLSAVIDLSEMTLAQQREYVSAFVGALNHLPRPLWHDCLVVIDEAHVFAPEAGKGSSVANEAIAMLLSTGRKRGYCGVLATQRLSKLSKDVAAECLNKLIGRTSNEDVRRAADELDQAKSEARELRSLEPGMFWAYGPAISPEPILVRTGDVLTAPPARGAARAPAPAAPKQIQAVLTDLADLPKQAADEQRSIADLEKLNRQLRADLKRAQSEGAVRVVEKPVADERAVARAVATATRRADERRAGLAREFTRSVRTLGKSADELVAVADSLRSLAARAEAALLADESTPIPEPVVPSARVIPTLRPVASRPIRQTSNVAVSTVSGPQQRMLDTLASFEATGVDAIAYSHLAVFSGQSSKSSGFDKNLSVLSAAGLVERIPGKSVRLTDEGRNLANAAEQLTTLDQLHDAWMARLSGPQRLMMTLLIGAYPNAIDRDELARSSGQSPTSSGYDKNVTVLASLGLLEREGRERKAAALLFPEGLT